MNSHTLTSLKEHFSEIQNQFEGVLFGSQASETASLRSDYDIAIITRSDNHQYNLQKQWDVLKYSQSNLDIRIFELLPLTVQISIIQNYKVIWGDPLEISEYFYSFRKIWKDCRHRILSNQLMHYSERLKYIQHQKNA